MHIYFGSGLFRRPRYRGLLVLLYFGGGFFGGLRRRGFGLFLCFGDSFVRTLVRRGLVILYLGIGSVRALGQRGLVLLCIGGSLFFVLGFGSVRHVRCVTLVEAGGLVLAFVSGILVNEKDR